MRVLLIRPGALGDVLLTLPVVQALHSQWPDITIDMMGNPAVLRLLCGRTAVHAVWSFDGLDIGPMFHPEARPTSELGERFGGYDVTISYAGPADGVFARNLTRIAQGRVIHWDARAGSHIGMHMSEFLQRPLLELGVPLCADPPRLRLTAQDRQQAAAWFAEHSFVNGPSVALHPGSGSPAKNWPAEQFAGLARCLDAAAQQVVLIVGPADGGPANVVQGEMRGMSLTAAVGLPLWLVAAILECCAGYVGNDSGISHLAAAVGVPVVAIFGPTDPRVWAPRGGPVTVLRGSAARESSEDGPLHSLETVSVQMVIGALQAMSALPEDL